MRKITDKLYHWASILDEKALQQQLALSRLPIIAGHVAGMPDTHFGMGAPVGTVIPTVRSLIPAAVGVDIGCGMIAILTQWTADDLANIDLKRLHNLISLAVPSSAGRYNAQLRNAESFRKRLNELDDMPGHELAAEVTKKAPWPYQLGSLGSGNHFIEISLDEYNRVWVFLHSGSRGVGNKMAMHHIAIAKNVSKAKGYKLESPDLAYLTEDEDEFWHYLRDLRWAQRFALLNRDEMADRVIGCLEEVMGETAERVEIVRCHHNYTEEAYIDPVDTRDRVWLSRKGAIDASKGKAGLIPGSMGAASYVVYGLGNVDSWHSAPHGAGRNFSRGEAKRRFTYDDLAARMKGVAWGESDKFLDEHPEAYKAIDVVMEDAADLVSIRHTLRQVVNVKGI